MKAIKQAAAKSHLANHILPALGKLRLEEIGSEGQQMPVSRLAGQVSRRMHVNILATVSSIFDNRLRGLTGCFEQLWVRLRDDWKSRGD